MKRWIGASCVARTLSNLLNGLRLLVNGQKQIWFGPQSDGQWQSDIQKLISGKYFRPHKQYECFWLFLKLQLQKYKWAKGNLKYQRWSHLLSMTLSPSMLPKKALRLFVMLASSLLVLGNKWYSPKLTVTVANLNCVHLYWIVFVFVIATGRSSTSHRSHGLCHWFH